MIYAILRLLSIVVFKLFFSLKVEGRQNIPEKGGAILASNHASYTDVLLIGCGIGRHLKYVAKAELFKKFFSRVIWTYLGGIPINRRGVNLDSFKKIVDEVEKGSLVVIFPEGTRVPYGEKGEIKPGIIALYKMVDAPIIPVSLNSGRLWPRNSFIKKPGLITVTFHEPIEKGLSREEFVKRLEEQINPDTTP